MLDTGLRLSETVFLRYEDVHLEDRYVKVLGKGNKERIVAFGAVCLRALARYLHHYRVESAGPEVREFFISIDGYAMTSNALRSLTERVSHAAGVSRLHPHLLRHTYATEFLLNGGDVFLLKQNLGHTTLAMVERYVHIASQKAALMSQRLSPLDQFKVPTSRRFSHPVNRDDARGRIYPNSGRNTKAKRYESR